MRADAAEVAGQRLAQREAPEPAAVVELRVGRLRRRVRDRAGPLAAREERDVGRRRREVEAHDGAARGFLARRLGGRRGGHDGAGAAPRGEPALGRQLLVGVGDDAARDAELRGERPRRGQANAGAEPARTDRVAQLAGELAPQRHRRSVLEREQHARAGVAAAGGLVDVHGHMIGPIDSPVNGSGHRTTSQRILPL